MRQPPREFLHRVMRGNEEIASRHAVTQRTRLETDRQNIFPPEDEAAATCVIEVQTRLSCEGKMRVLPESTLRKAVVAIVQSKYCRTARVQIGTSKTLSGTPRSAE